MSNIFCSATHLSSVPWLLLIRFFLRHPWHFPSPLSPSYLHPASCLDITRLLFRLLPIHFLNLKALLSVKPSYLFHTFPFLLLNLSESPCRQWPRYHWLPRTPFLASINPGFLGAVHSACHLVITDFLLSLLFDLVDGADTFLRIFSELLPNYIAYSSFFVFVSHSNKLHDPTRNYMNADLWMCHMSLD